MHKKITNMLLFMSLISFACPTHAGGFERILELAVNATPSETPQTEKTIIRRRPPRKYKCRLDRFIGVPPLLESQKKRIKFPNLYRYQTLDGDLKLPCNLLLLYGDSGYGKSGMLKALVEDTGGSCMEWMDNLIVAAYMHQSEESVCEVFAEAIKKAQLYPASFIFIDQIDTLTNPKFVQGQYHPATALWEWIKICRENLLNVFVLSEALYYNDVDMSFKRTVLTHSAKLPYDESKSEFCTPNTQQSPSTLEKKREFFFQTLNLYKSAKVDWEPVVNAIAELTDNEIEEVVHEGALYCLEDYYQEYAPGEIEAFEAQYNELSTLYQQLRNAKAAAITSIETQQKAALNSLYIRFRKAFYAEVRDRDLMNQLKQEFSELKLNIELQKEMGTDDDPEVARLIAAIKEKKDALDFAAAALNKKAASEIVIESKYVWKALAIVLQNLEYTAFHK